MQKDTQKKEYWFEAKTYGYGWVPVTWQAWVIILMYIGGSFGFVRLAHGYSFSLLPSIVAGANVLILTGLLIGICYLKGEKPKWKWGK